jgi:HAE1 family hydrophobic/amphiphilic exporter-1
MLLAFLSAVMVFLLISGLFESISMALIIITSVLFACMGVCITLFITSTRLSIPVYLGIVFLAGTVVNNAIVIMTTIMQALDEDSTGHDAHEIILQACLSDFRPIMITTISTIAGFIPSLVEGGEGSALWRPLSTTVIGGLIPSTVLTMFVIPLACGRFIVSRTTSKPNEVSRP